MYIEDAEHLTALQLCLKDIEAAWGNLETLTGSIGWKRSEVRANCYEFGFEDNGTLRVYEYDGDVQICLEA
jgi:hypothetical protein